MAISPAWAVKPFSADYQASYMGLQGNGRMTLVAQGPSRWKYTLSIDSTIARLSQSTVFEDRDGQWRPLSSTDSSLLLIKKVDKNANYDWNAGVATWTGDVKSERAGPIALQKGDMDALMINLALARDVAAGKPLNYRMVDDGRAKQLSYQIAGKETITIDGKSQQATKVMRTDGDKQTIAWVVDGLQVPARILQQKDGKDEIDLRIKSMR
ncbi:MAG: DUF3108 domain-containing protein [Luteimonas sp.]